jgi:hypothetical protein
MIGLYHQIYFHVIEARKPSSFNRCRKIVQIRIVLWKNYKTWNALYTESISSKHNYISIRPRKNEYCNYFLCKSPWRWPIFSLDGAVTYKIVLSAKSRTSDSIYSFLHVEQILSQVPNTGPHGVCDWAFSCYQTKEKSSYKYLFFLIWSLKAEANLWMLPSLFKTIITLKKYWDIKFSSWIRGFKHYRQQSMDKLCFVGYLFSCFKWTMKSANIITPRLIMISQYCLFVYQLAIVMQNQPFAITIKKKTNMYMNL